MDSILCCAGKKGTQDTQVAKLPFLVTYKMLPSFEYIEDLGCFTDNLSNFPDYIPEPAPPPTSKSEIFDRNDFSAIDKRAIQTPRKYHNQPFDKLVPYLTKGLSDDLSKVRIIYRWITAQRIDEMKFPRDPPSDRVAYHLWRIQRHKGNHAQLVALMCRYAGLPCVIVHGRLKGATYDIGMDTDTDSTYGEWNAVLVDKQWRFINAFWGGSAEVVKPSETDTQTDSHCEDYKWATRDEIWNTPNRSTDFQFQHLLFRLLKSGATQRYDDYVFMHKANADELDVRIRSPVAGDFRFELVGRDVSEKNSEYDWIVIYKMKFEDDVPDCKPFPVCPMIGWGPGFATKKLGLRAVTHKNGEIALDRARSCDIRFEPIEELDMNEMQFRASLVSSDPTDMHLKYHTVHRIETMNSFSVLMYRKKENMPADEDGSTTDDLSHIIIDYQKGSSGELNFSSSIVDPRVVAIILRIKKAITSRNIVKLEGGIGELKELAMPTLGSNINKRSENWRFSELKLNLEKPPRNEISRVWRLSLRRYMNEGMRIGCRTNWRRPNRY
ncbi:hypothetical protein ScPMuIL_007810 [Solemya velum]